MTWTRLVSTLLILPLAACGGGGSTGAINGLQGPQQVSIVEGSNGSNNTLRLPRGVRGVAGSAYMTDTTRFWIRDDSMAVLDQVNSILGYLHDTNYWEQVNNGPYRALVESDGGDERGNSGPSYEDWVVNSTRASNADPQIVHFWVPGDEDNVASTIYGRLTVTEEPTDAQPLGAFTLYFKSLPNTEPPTSTATSFEGYIRTIARNDGQTELEFFMGQGDAETTPNVGERVSRQRAHFVGDMDADTGRAYSELLAKENNSGTIYTQESEYQLQFNAAYVARKNVVSTAVDVLDRNDFDTRVYRYGLYNATTEARVNQLSGFPVTDDNGNQGWAGFHGVWFPQSVTLTDGMTLTRRSFGSSTTTPYTLVKVPGRLQKRSRASITLADILNEDLQMFDPAAGGQAKVRFTGADFVRVAEGDGSGGWNAITPVSIVSNYQTGQWLNFWSQARGSVEFSWPSTLSGTVPAYVWSHSVVNADSPELANGDLTLHGYFHMLRSNITTTQANFTSGDSPYLPDATSVSSGNQVYTFDKASLMLLLGSNPVNFGNGVTVTTGPGMQGLNCGPLFATALTSFNDMQNQTTTYDWNIGSNSWNQLLALKTSGGAFVNFTAPLRFTYVHSESGSPFDGRTFFLEWDGTNLHGIPYEQDGNGRYYPLFNIPTGSTVTAGNTTYKIKQLEGEQIMQAVGDPNTVFTAQGFDLSTSLSAPTAAPFQDPAIGVRPTVTTPPIYVGGVSQTGG